MKTKRNKKSTSKKKYTQFRPRVYTRHPSHTSLRPRQQNLPLLPVRSVVRLGSTTDKPDTVSKGGDRIEVNTIEGVQNAENKHRMKDKFDEYNVPTPKWYTINRDGDIYDEREQENVEVEDLDYPIIFKKVMGSRGRGIQKADNSQDLRDIIDNCENPSRYILEEFVNYPREYRLHVSDQGCFYTCRKMLRGDTNEQDRWYRNQENCVWYVETNPSFNKPNNWDAIERECVNALNAVGLDIGACDVKVSRGTNDHGDHDFMILEINSAPRFGEITEEKYLEMIPSIIQDKAQV